MEIGHERQASERSRFSIYGTALIRIIVRQKAVTGTIGIIAETQMATDDVRKGLDIAMDTGQLQSTQQHLSLRRRDISFGPVAAIREVLPQGRRFFQSPPVRPLHRLAKLTTLFDGPKILNDEHRRLMKRKRVKNRCRLGRLDKP